MIFVTVGHKEFDRLIRSMDRIAQDGVQEIVMQIGYRPHFAPSHARYFPFVSREEMESYCQQAAVIVGHCSVGLLLDAAAFRKPFIAVPRQHRYGEHIDDHQTDLAQELVQRKIIDSRCVVYDITGLQQAIGFALTAPVVYEHSDSRKALIEEIRAFVARSS